VWMVPTAGAAAEVQAANINASSHLDIRRPANSAINWKSLLRRCTRLVVPEPLFLGRCLFRLSNNQLICFSRLSASR
jgi:hypothetical protein